MTKKASLFGSIWVIFCLFYSCSTIHQELDPKIYYKRDMKIKIGDNKYEGTAVLRNAPKIDIEFTSAGKLDLFTFTTCHREYTQENAKSFFNKKKIKFEYKPEPTIELVDSCAIQAAGYDLKGKHSWAFLDIETPDAKLPATIKCNGLTWKSNGVTICQGKAGLFQEIIFEVEVKFAPQFAKRKECQEIDFINKENKRFIYKLPNRECVFTFMSGKNEFHRLNTIGYEMILIR